MKFFLRCLVVGAVLVGIYWMVARFSWLVIHLSQETGTSDSASRSYDYWSGFGSVFPWSLAILGGIAGLFHKHNCHVKGCWRIGKFDIDGTPYTVCPKHHPDVPDKVTHAHILQAHKEVSDK